MITRSRKLKVPVKSIFQQKNVPWTIISTTFKDEDVQNLKKTRMDRCIFNPDKKRLQADLPSSNPVIEQILSLIKEYLQGRRIGPTVLLCSLKGCQKQRFHRDYDPNLIQEEKPLGVLVALDNDTKIYTLEKKIELHRGDILIFDGDFIHAGGDYEFNNYRIHIYLETNYKCRENSKTYLFNAKFS